MTVRPESIRLANVNDRSLNDGLGAAELDDTYPVPIDFAEPIAHVAIRGLATVRAHVYRGDTFLGQTGFSIVGGFGFRGISSDTEFDRIERFDSNTIAIDDFRFQTIPAPAPAGCCCCRFCRRAVGVRAPDAARAREEPGGLVGAGPGPADATGPGDAALAARRSCAPTTPPFRR